MNRISEIKERFRKRTKGEWRCIPLTSKQIIYKIETKNHITIAIVDRKSNAKFIKYAPEDINYLVAKNEKLKEKLAFENKCYIACSSTLTGMTKDWRDAKDECEQVKKELAKLKEEIKHANIKRDLIT